MSLVAENRVGPREVSPKTKAKYKKKNKSKQTNEHMNVYVIK